jgi:nucleoside-diphosphate-sugar epimerase
MKVMVTGATSTFGSALVDALLLDPRVTFVAAVGDERESARCGAKLHYFAADLRRSRVAHDLLWGEARELGINVVINLVPYADVTRHLVVACTGHPTIRRFIQRSFAEIYAAPDSTTTLVDEDARLCFDSTSSRVRERMAADLLACAHNSHSLGVAVLRLAEVLAPDCDSQLWDYLQSRVCLRPLGFDPMINVLSLEDAVHALVAAVFRSPTGVFNIPGATTLPLSMAIQQSSRADIPVPGAFMGPLYALRRRLAGFEFRYDLNLARFHFGGVLDGTRAKEELDFVATTPVHWPRPWWRLLLSRLGDDRASAPA